MATKAYLQSAKNPDLRFEIVKFDPATKTATLKGKYGHFEMANFSREKVTKEGYTLVTEAV